MSYQELLNHRKDELTTNWLLGTTEDDAKEIINVVLQEINEKLQSLLPEGVTYKGVTADLLYNTLTNDRWWWNGEQDQAGLYVPIEYLVNFSRGTTNIITEQLNVLDMQNSVRVASLGDEVLRKGGLTDGDGRGVLSKIDADGTEFISISISGVIEDSSCISNIIANYTK